MKKTPHTIELAKRLADHADAPDGLRLLSGAVILRLRHDGISSALAKVDDYIRNTEEALSDRDLHIVLSLRLRLLQDKGIPSRNRRVTWARERWLWAKSLSFDEIGRFSIGLAIVLLGFWIAVTAFVSEDLRHEEAVKDVRSGISVAFCGAILCIWDVWNKRLQ